MKQKTIVYVISKKRKPLMPTTRCGHVRKLFDEGKAVVINSNPFTIRLKYDTPEIIQDFQAGSYIYPDFAVYPDFFSGSWIGS